MYKLLFLLILLPFHPTEKKADSYSVEVYKKIELPYGTLDEGCYSTIDYIYERATLRPGKYSVTIDDYKGSLYEVEGTSYYLKFDYTPDKDEGVLDIETEGYYGTYYDKPDDN